MSDITDESEFDYPLPSTDYFDLAGTWNVTDSISLRLGINNLMDEDPPLATCCGGNTVAGVYDALGRYWFAGMNVRL
jgi:outer membrane receptor protein involved in Fe transport